MMACVSVSFCQIQCSSTQLNSTKPLSQINWGFHAAKAKIINLLVIAIFSGKYTPQYHFLEGESMRVMYEVWFVKSLLVFFFFFLI